MYVVWNYKQNWQNKPIMNAERTNVHTASNYGHGHILTYLDSPILFLLQQTHITNLHNWKLSCLLQYIFIHMLLHCFHYMQQLSYCFNLNLVRYLRFQGNDWLQVAFFSFKVLLGLFQTLRKESIKYIWSYCFLLLQRL